MPIDKDNEGKGPTVQIGIGKKTIVSSKGQDRPDGAKTQRTGSDSGAESSDAFGRKTRIIGQQPPSVSDRPDTERGPGIPTPGRDSGSGRKTRLFMPGQDEEDPANSQMNASEDPVVGWLVIVDGPGKGHSLEIGAGMNSVGRGRDQRIQLDFGDDAISSNKHFFVSYDPRSGEFGIHRGEGANLTYLDKAPVYGSEKLASYAEIEVGATTLRFVALCGENFSWA